MDYRPVETIVEEAPARLGFAVDRQWVYRRVADGLPHLRLGRRIYLRWLDIEEFGRRGTAGASGELSSTDRERALAARSRAEARRVLWEVETRDDRRANRALRFVRGNGST